MSTIIGKLKFKGKFDEKQKKKEEKIKKIIEQKEDEQQDLGFMNKDKGEKKKFLKKYKEQLGEGKIMSSGKTIHGFETKFQQILKRDDFLSVKWDDNEELEERKIAAVMSDKSILLWEPFSRDISFNQDYYYRKQDELIVEGDTLEEQYEKKYLDVTKKIQKEVKPVQTLEYREKKGMWGYRQVKENLDGDFNREKILNLRAKKNRDKFCWI